MAKPVVSVIVCTYNRAKLLPSCLQSLAEQSASRETYEVIIIDNNCTDNTQEILHDFTGHHENFRYVVEKQQGLSHSRNRGWREAMGRYVAYIDDDAKASPEWCERILNAFKTVLPPPAAVGGQIHPWYETVPPPWFMDDFEIRSWGNERGFLKPPRAQYGFSGSNMAFPKNILHAYGGFSADYGIVGGKLRMGEDTELFIRIYDKEPWFWYDPSIKVSHWVPKRNMRVSYRFLRAFKSGEFRANMQDRSVYLRGYPKSLFYLIFLVAKLPFAVLIFRKKMTEFVKLIEGIGAVMGYLTGKNIFSVLWTSKQ
jgi:glycosyltransferase involved in cell wall biosynthesis